MLSPHLNFCHVIRWRRRADNVSRNRAVHVKIKPRTLNTHESREVLKILKGYGEVVWYQNQRYDHINPAPHTLICIYEKPESAAELIRESPLRFSIPPASSITTPVASIASMRIMDAFKTETSESQSGYGAAPGFEHEENFEKEFILNADVSLVDHEAVMQSKEFSWGFRMHIRNQAQATLGREVPEQGMAPLPVDQRTVPARIVNRELKAVEKQVADWKSRLWT